MLAAYLQLAGAMILAGSTVAAAKPVVAVVPVYVFGALRFAIAAAILVPLARRAGLGPATRRDLAAAVLLAFFGAFLFTVLILEGVSRTSALDAALITSTIPAATLLLSALLLRERLTPRRAAAVLLATAGIAAVALPGAAGGATRSLLGNLLVVAAVFSEAMFTVLAKRLGAALSPVPLAAVTAVSATAMFLPFAAVQVGGGGWPAIDAATWGLILFYSTAGSVLAFLLWFQGLRRVDAGVAGAFTALLPVSGAALAVLALGERPHAGHAVALILALAAIALATGPGRPRARSRGSA